MTNKTTKLFYVYDPMCSWCWGYQPTLTLISNTLQTQNIPWTKVLGGLAPDTDEVMPADLQTAIRGYWRKIHALLGTRFNHDFWTNNSPRRATYPACRAILIARRHGLEDEMNQAIQHAYYLHARNPSDNTVLCALADELGLDPTGFEEALNLEETHSALQHELHLARAIGGNSFPSWILEKDGHRTSLPIDYKDPETVITSVLKAFK